VADLTLFTADSLDTPRFFFTAADKRPDSIKVRTKIRGLMVENGAEKSHQDGNWS
jgi:hypothetical protein